MFTVANQNGAALLLQTQHFGDGQNHGETVWCGNLIP